MGKNPGKISSASISSGAPKISSAPKSSGLLLLQMNQKHGKLLYVFMLIVHYSLAKKHYNDVIVLTC